MATLASVTLVHSGTVRASYDPISSGQANLTLANGFARTLAAHGVKIDTVSPASRPGRSYSLPVEGGALDPTLQKGEVDTDGSLVFERGVHRVRLRDVVTRVKREFLTAKVGGGQLKLARAGKLTYARVGFGSQITANQLRLTEKFATRLGKKLRLRGVFEEGQLLGTMRVEAQPQTIAVQPIGRASLTPDPAFLEKLNELFVSMTPVAPAERAAGPVFSFPIIEAGQLAPSVSLGTLRSGGAVEFLQLGAGQIFWTEPWFDFGAETALAEADLEPTPAFPGKLGQLPLLSIGPGAVTANGGARTISVGSAPLTLNGASAEQFNRAFAGSGEVFRSGEPIGTLDFTARTQ